MNLVKGYHRSCCVSQEQTVGTRGAGALRVSQSRSSKYWRKKDHYKCHWCCEHANSL